MRWLLDTNVWINYLKDASNPITDRLRNHTPAEIVVCSVVKAELFHGALKYGVADRRLSIVRETLAPYVSLVFDDPAARHYATIRHELEIGGNVIGPHDLFIAATCLLNDCTLVTSNRSEFSRVKGLLVEDWLDTWSIQPDQT